MGIELYTEELKEFAEKRNIPAATLVLLAKNIHLQEKIAYLSGSKSPSSSNPKSSVESRRT